MLLFVPPGLVQADATPPFVIQWGGLGTGDGQFAAGAALAVDGSGNVYVVDTQNQRIQKFTSGGIFMTAWGRQGKGRGEFDAPEGIAVDGSGHVYVADTRNHRIQKFTSSGNFVRQWGKEGVDVGEFTSPTGIAADTSGNVYVLEEGLKRIQAFTTDGTEFDTWRTLEPAYPRSLAVDSANGIVYVMSYEGAGIQAFTASGTAIVSWGTHGTGPGKFEASGGVAVDSSGHVYVTDYHKVEKFGGAGAFLFEWGQLGNGPGQFHMPQSLAVDAAGNVYVFDANSRIQKFGGGPKSPVGFAPPGLNFGVTGPTAPALVRSVSLTNNTTVNLTVFSADVAGPEALEFDVVGETCTEAPLAPGGTCSIDVSFNPASLGGRSATLSVDSNAPGSPYAAALSGFNRP
jgi:sugar lactone lactonase YvrE